MAAMMRGDTKARGRAGECAVHPDFHAQRSPRKTTGDRASTSSGGSWGASLEMTRPPLAVTAAQEKDQRLGRQVLHRVLRGRRGNHIRQTGIMNDAVSRELYAKRKHTPEPVFGIIKSVLGFRQFLLRGLEKVKAEWTLVTLAWNMKRMFALKAA